MQYQVKFDGQSRARTRDVEPTLRLLPTKPRARSNPKHDSSRRATFEKLSEAV